jgi:methionyl-tRNA formyltransferase
VSRDQRSETSDGAPISLACILGHRYGRRLVSALLASDERLSGAVRITKALCLHPAVSFVTGGYEQAFDLLEAGGVPHDCFERIATEEAGRQLESAAPDFVFVCGLRQLIPESILRIPGSRHQDSAFFSRSFGFLGFHPSDLPDGAGMSPVQWTILEGASQMTVSMFFLAPGEPDSGPIIGKHTIRGLLDPSATELDAKVGDAIARLVRSILPRIARDDVPFVEQTELGVPRRVRPATRVAQRWLEDSNTVSQALRTVRAFARPYGGALTMIDGKVVRVFGARADSGGAGGGGLSCDGTLRMSCKDGTILLTDIDRYS